MVRFQLCRRRSRGSPHAARTSTSGGPSRPVVSDDPRDPLCRRASGLPWNESSTGAGGLEARRTRLAPRPAGKATRRRGTLKPFPSDGVPPRWSRCRGALATSLETPCAERIPGHGRSNTSTTGWGLSLWSFQRSDAVPARPGAGIRLLRRRVAWFCGGRTARVGVSGRCWRVGSARGVGRIP